MHLRDVIGSRSVPSLQVRTDELLVRIEKRVWPGKNTKETDSQSWGPGGYRIEGGGAEVRLRSGRGGCRASLVAWVVKDVPVMQV